MTHFTPVAEHPARLDSAAARELVSEHGALTRLLGGLQRRMGELLRSHALQVRALEGEILRLRGQLVVARTGLLWGLPRGRRLAGTLTLRPATTTRPPAGAAAPALAPDPALREANAVICQTGCVGHAHPWLELDGQCRRTGQACELRGEPSESPQMPQMPDVPER